MSGGGHLCRWGGSNRVSVEHRIQRDGSQTGKGFGPGRHREEKGSLADRREKESRIGLLIAADALALQPGLPSNRRSRVGGERCFGQGPPQQTRLPVKPSGFERTRTLP